MKGTLARRVLRNGLIVLAACAAGWSGAHAAGVAPAAGRFLVAKKAAHGIFAHSVVLLIAYGPRGAMGLIINRPTQFPAARALPDMDGLHGSGASLYIGGPVALRHATFLIRSASAPPESVHVLDDVYATGHLETLQAIVSGKSPSADFRVYVGYAGWGPGQLEAEIARGGWLVLPASAGEVFTTDPAGLWHRLIQRKGVRLAWKLPAGFPAEEAPSEQAL